MSTRAGTITPPFAGVSFAELRSLEADKRTAMSQVLPQRQPLPQRPALTRPKLAVQDKAPAPAESWSLAAPTFDALLADGDSPRDTGIFPAEAMKLDFTPPQGSHQIRGRSVLVGGLGTVLPGVGILLGLMWLSSALTEPPAWLPEQLWLGSWSRLVGQ